MDTLLFTNVVQASPQIQAPAIINVYSNGVVTVTIDGKCVFNIYFDNADQVTGVTFISNALVYTVAQSNILHFVRYNSTEAEPYLFSQIILSEYNSIQVMKNVMNTDYTWIMLAVFSTERTGRFIIYDIDMKKRINTIPFEDKLLDLAVVNVGSDCGSQPGRESMQEEGVRNMILYGETSRIVDIDFDEIEYTLVRLYQINQKNSNQVVIDELGIREGMTDTFTEHRYSFRAKKSNMKFPLDYFFREWPDDGKGCISSSGKYLVFLYSNLTSPLMIISDAMNGDVYRIFDMPKELLGAKRETAIIYYDDRKDYLTIVQTEQCLSVTYHVTQDDNLIKELNNVYNAYIQNNSRNRIMGNAFDLNARICWKAVESAVVQKVQ